MTMEEEVYDYVIVGSGAAGCVLADRLSRDGKSTVAVLEAGRSDLHPIHRLPKGFVVTMNDPAYTKTYETQPYGSGIVERWVRGRVVGGSTTINGMMWNRGWAPSYDAWEATGVSGWNWKRFLAAFKALENHELGGNKLRGGDGPIPISIARPADPVSDAFMEAAAKHGITIQEDVNSSGDERIGYMASNISRGLRVSAASAFLRKAQLRTNCKLLKQFDVERVVFDGIRAIGVEGYLCGRRTIVSSRREVILCAGALESPLLLERSGIGDPMILAAAGVQLRIASPQVGENLQDHCGSTMFQLRLKGQRGFNRELGSKWRQLWTGLKFLFLRKGVMSFGGHSVIAIFRSDPSSPHPDTQGFFSPLSSSAIDPSRGQMAVDSFSGAMFTTYPLQPTSRGSIHITGPKIANEPRLVPSIPTTERDRRLTAKIFNKSREILSTEPFASLVDYEMVPGNAVSDDDAALDYAINTGSRGFHTVGTCVIGGNDNSVVDERLRVRGAENLRVVDASVFPVMPSGNNNAPTMAMAWIAADIIAEDAKSQNSNPKPGDSNPRWRPH